MRLFRPPNTLIRSIQDHDGRFYFSAAFEVILKKHGLTLSDEEVSSFPTAHEFGFVARESPWQEAFRSLPLVFEGPLAATVCTELGVRIRNITSEQLDLYDQQGSGLGTLRFNLACLRRIPVHRFEKTEPYPFLAKDQRWSPRAFTFQALDVAESTEGIIFGVDGSGLRHCIGIRRGPHWVFGVPLFDIMVQHHAIAPYPDNLNGFSASSDLEPLERWLLMQADLLFRQYRRVCVATAPWPYPKHACLTIRHDFDRPLNGNAPKHRSQRADISRLLGCYAKRGIKSTWFWRVATYDEELIARVIAAGHEIALHTEAFTFDQWFDKEVRFFRECVGLSIDGYTVHGGRGAPGCLGQHQIGWALASGMRYGELLCQHVTLPTLAVILENDILTASDLVLPARHNSFDVSTRTDDHRLETILPESAAALAAGQHRVVMNHPDIHVDQMIAFAETINLQGAWQASMAEVARWSLGRARAYRRDAAGTVFLGWQEPLPYTAAISIGYGEQVYSAEIPQGTCAAQVMLTNERPEILSIRSGSSPASIAVQPSGQKSVLERCV